MLENLSKNQKLALLGGGGLLGFLFMRSRSHSATVAPLSAPAGTDASGDGSGDGVALPEGLAAAVNSNYKVGAQFFNDFYNPYFRPGSTAKSTASKPAPRPPKSRSGRGTNGSIVIRTTNGNGAIIVNAGSRVVSPRRGARFPGDPSENNHGGQYPLIRGS